ncbi:MAG: hypothetical protein II969_00630 [Anaerolineaceae bacterium]|nr:hypothetical protein [Anaerolineaceae bacterium]
MERGIEKFPVEKRQIRYEEPPELIFFDVDEDQEEADFIRVDDLFSSEDASAQKLTGKVTFTLFPQKDEDIIDSRLSRMIRRTLILSGLRLEHPTDSLRIRPKFAQWTIELGDTDEAEQLIREFRADMEEQTHSMKKIPAEERYWSDNCFVCPADKNLSDDTIIRAADHYRKQAA